MTPLRIPLKVVFYQEGGSWIAHCLEFDLLGDGATKKGAVKQLTRAIFLQLEASIKHDNPANLFSPADGELFRRFAAGKHSDVATGELCLSVDPITIEHVDAREYAEPVLA